MLWTIFKLYILKQNTTYIKDNGNSVFDDTTTVLELCSVNCDFDLSIDNIICGSNVLVETVLIYISGFIMRTLMKKENCLLCYTYLKESKNRVTCPLINTKQVGGLIYPTADVVFIVNFANWYV
jgi:hypothetical protein